MSVSVSEIGWRLVCYYIALAEKENVPLFTGEGGERGYRTVVSFDVRRDGIFFMCVSIGPVKALYAP